MGYLQLAIFSALLICFVRSVEVKIGESTITGNTAKNYAKKRPNEFLGIPYAEPPVGARRFLKPEPISSYPKEVEATKYRPACPQYSKKPFPWYYDDIVKSEDCLYLNIWTPEDASKDNKKAVLFWIPGALHRYGAINNPIFYGARLVVRGDIVVVTIGYRMGYFGFLTSDSEDAPGNVGLYDVLEGLKWVKKNIEYFGGDKSKVTIGGQGSGAIIVGLLAVSPLADGLFARHIMQSASPVYRRADDKGQNLARSQKVAEYFKCANDSYTIDKKPKEVIECLRGIDAMELSYADYSLSVNEPYNMVPTWGDDFLPKNPRKAIMEGDWKCKDLFFGTNDNDGAFFVTSYENAKKFGFFGHRIDRLQKSEVEDIIRKQARLFPDPESVMRHYIPEDFEVKGEEDLDYLEDKLIDSASEINLVCPTIYYAQKCAEQNRKVFQYFFTNRPTLSPWVTWLGSTFYDEVAFVFGVPSRDEGYEQWEEFLSERVMYAWSNFVKTGNPSYNWAEYNNDTREYKEIYGAITSENLDTWHFNEDCDFLKDKFED